MPVQVTKADVQKARQAIADMADIEPELQNAKAIGIDCEEECQRCQQMKQFLIDWNEVYSPRVSSLKT